jgi:hypothetical protein
MTLTNSAVSEITRNVAAEQTPDIDIVGVLSSGGSERIELLLAMRGTDEESRRYMITVPRTDAGEFESELRRKLNEVVIAHGVAA